MLRSEDKHNEMEDILQELLATSDKPTPQLLADFIQRYPQHAAEILSFASEWALQESMGHSEETDSIDEKISLAKAGSELQNALFRFDRKSLSGAVNDIDPFAGKSIDDLKTIAALLDIDRPIIAKIRDRKIQPATIPQQFSQELATAMSVPLECMIAYHSRPPVVHANTNFKATVAPEATNQQTFEEALRSSSRYSEIKRRWKLT